MININGHAIPQEVAMTSVKDASIDKDSELLTPSSPSPSVGSECQTTSPGSLQTHATIHEVKVDPVIPSRRRTLVLCFDGTGDQFDNDNSNVVQLVSLLKKDDRHEQMVYYQSGIGTYTLKSTVSPVRSWIQKALDLVLAWNLGCHIKSGYEFLMQNYVPGDKICIFGFSRGAYTARSLAGMVYKVGLLPASNLEQVPFAYKMYTRVDSIGWEQSNDFKKAFCTDVTIDFLGVWDTVDSVGLFPKRLPFTTANAAVRTFRHAVSLDERRAKFKANLWNRQDAPPNVAANCQPQSPVSPGTEKSSTPPSPEIPQLLKDSAPKSPGTGQGDEEKKTKKKKNKKHRRRQSDEDRELNKLERIYSSKRGFQTDIEEVWFAGCHCDVGGGSVSNKTRHSLARIPLRWMIRECFKAKTGMMFESEGLRQLGMDPTTLYPSVTPRPPPHLPAPNDKICNLPADPIPIRLHSTLTKKHKADTYNDAKSKQHALLGSEEEEELRDALSPKYDQLKLKKMWWALEIIPMQLKYQRGDDKWVTTFQSNLAQPRKIPKQIKGGIKVHRSVRLRMEAEYEDEKKGGKKYTPKAHWRVEPTWID